MTWEEIRRCYPERFVLLDNCEEERVGQNKIVITKGEVVFDDDDGQVIYDEYCKRGQTPRMTFGHTHWDRLEMEEVSFIGVRPAYA